MQPIYTQSPSAKPQMRRKKKTYSNEDQSYIHYDTCINDENIIYTGTYI